MKTVRKKTIKELPELGLTLCNKKVTLQWENRVKGLIKVALKRIKC